MSFGVLFIICNVIAMVVIKWLLNNKQRSHTLAIVRKLVIFGYSLFLLSFITVEGLIIKEAYSKEIYETEEIDFVIILGAGLRGEEPSKTLQGRLDAGLTFLKENQDIPVIVSGGQGPGETITEAEAMGTFLVENGVDKERIIYESLSTDTDENLKFSGEMMTQLGMEKPKVLIITSDYHLFRAKLLANDYGLTAYGLGGDSPFFVKVNYYIREYFGVVKDFVL
ncbi:YdcF family protein [Robertmurraya korlensis]|uniref:YdcF family protein n=1 Tax=Robertmurraya korlensis TaxID=519977 RepID=UPI000824B944|nr:YdcF family protein [Robertmurraya korlensis]